MSEEKIKFVHKYRKKRLQCNQQKNTE